MFRSCDNIHTQEISERAKAFSSSKTTKFKKRIGSEEPPTLETSKVNSVREMQKLLDFKKDMESLESQFSAFVTKVKNHKSSKKCEKSAKIQDAILKVTKYMSKIEKFCPVIFS